MKSHGCFLSYDYQVETEVAGEVITRFPCLRSCPQNPDVNVRHAAPDSKVQE